jgi:hypothetical protein
MQRFVRGAVIIVYLLAVASLPWRVSAQSQTETAPEAAPVLPAGLAEVVQTQFGPCFRVAAQRDASNIKYLHPEAQAPWTPFVIGDLDGDGVEDAVIVTRCKDPLSRESEYNYKVVDPYFAAHGYGNPKVTAQFNREDPRAQFVLLIIHGAGADGWRAATPKAKFAVINLEFQAVSLTRFTHRKHTYPAVDLQEGESLSSVIYWDGKKYRWVDVSGGN